MEHKNYYYELTFDQQKKLAQLIAEDNIEIVNKGFEQFVVPNTFYTRCGKRILDIVFSIVALIVFFPINIVIMVITFFDVGRPILFRQKRIGKDSKLFTIIKFRNMTEEIGENGCLLPADQRVTRWGRFVRRTSLDELLNFWSILKGDMSIIGPRPMPIDYYGRFSKFHDMRHKVRPGLECPMHDRRVSGSDWESRFDNDVWYVQNISFKTDIKLFWELVFEIFWSEKNKHRGRGFGAIGGDFMGYFRNGHVMSSDFIPDKYYEKLLKIEEANK